jgi:hypothetical protein
VQGPGGQDVGTLDCGEALSLAGAPANYLLRLAGLVAASDGLISMDQGCN